MAFQALSKWISPAYLDREQLEALATHCSFSSDGFAYHVQFFLGRLGSVAREGSEMVFAAHIGSNCELLALGLCPSIEVQLAGNLPGMKGIKHDQTV